MSLVLVLSSLAGCIAGEEEEDPTILVSTYHVAELVSAVVGRVVLPFAKVRV